MSDSDMIRSLIELNKTMYAQNQEFAARMRVAEEGNEILAKRLDETNELASVYKERISELERINNAQDKAIESLQNDVLKRNNRITELQDANENLRKKLDTFYNIRNAMDNV